MNRLPPDGPAEPLARQDHDRALHPAHRQRAVVGVDPDGAGRRPDKGPGDEQRSWICVDGLSKNPHIAAGSVQVGTHGHVLGDVDGVGGVETQIAASGDVGVDVEVGRIDPDAIGAKDISVERHIAVGGVQGDVRSRDGAHRKVSGAQGIFGIDPHGVGRRFGAGPGEDAGCRVGGDVELPAMMITPEPPLGAGPVARLCGIDRHCGPDDDRLQRPSRNSDGAGGGDVRVDCYTAQLAECFDVARALDRSADD